MQLYQYLQRFQTAEWKTKQPPANPANHNHYDYQSSRSKPMYPGKEKIHFLSPSPPQKKKIYIFFIANIWLSASNKICNFKKQCYSKLRKNYTVENHELFMNMPESIQALGG